MKLETAYIEVEYETSLYPFVESAEVEVHYLQYGEHEEYHKEILAVYVSERVPEKRVPYVIQLARQQFTEQQREGK